MKKQDEYKSYIMEMLEKMYDEIQKNGCPPGEKAVE